MPLRWVSGRDMMVLMLVLGTSMRSAAGVIRCYSPIALARAALLGALGVGLEDAAFGKVAREVLLREGSAIGQADVVAVVSFVRTGHWASDQQVGVT